MFYSRVRVRVRTVATLCFCTCVSFPGVQFICTAKQLGRAMCVHKCVFTDLICLYMLQLGEGKCVRTAYHITKQRPKTIQSPSKNITMFYSRVRVMVRTVATLCFCTCAS